MRKRREASNARTPMTATLNHITRCLYSPLGEIPWTPACLLALAPASPLITTFIPFLQIINWPFRPIFIHYSPRRKADIKALILWGSRKYPNLYWFRTHSQDCTLEPGTLSLFSKLRTRFSHHIPPTLLKQRFLNIESTRKPALNSHVSEAQSSS